MPLSFVTAINCMDGRIQEAVINYMKKAFGVKYVDMITEPGPDKILAEKENPAQVSSIRRRVKISVNHHASRTVAIIGHPYCSGNSALKADQIRHLREAKKTVEKFGFNVKVILLWVHEDWKTVEVISAE